MICEMCGKNKAIIHIQEVVDGHKRSLHFCASCSGNKTLSLHPSKETNLAKYIIDLSFPFEKGSKLFPKNLPAQCRTCGMGKDEFQESGRLGCPDCYGTFREFLEMVLPLMHSGKKHKGKILPGGNYDMTEELPERKMGSLQGRDSSTLSVLKQGLDEAVRTENFELAAILRDQLSDLKNNG